MQTSQRREVDARPFLTWAFGIGIAIWVTASAVVAIPHGQTHSIESMMPFLVLRDGAFPVWIGAFVCILAGFALRAWRLLDQR
jgi:hypothetical protein